MKIIHNIKELFRTLFWDISQAQPGDRVEFEDKNDGFCVLKTIEAVDRLDDGMKIWFRGECCPVFIPFNHRELNYYIDKIAVYE